MIDKCLYCYLPLEANEKDFHVKCSKKMFGEALVPQLLFGEKELEELAYEAINNQTTVTGVQAKLSLHLTKGNSSIEPKRFTIVGLSGGYILKPPSPNYKHLPEVEDVTMHLAELAKIKVVPHSLIRLKSDSLAYITKRIDRLKKEKIHMEDMCMLTERLSEDKYYGSHEQVAKVIAKHSVNPGLDIVNFYEVVLFSFLTGNADMHLKNFSLLLQKNVGYVFSPAYDLVATALVNPADDEDLSLTLNGKKKKLKRQDFITAFKNAKLDEKQQENMFKKMNEAKPLWMNFIEQSFLTKKMQNDYKAFINERFERLLK